MKTLLVLLALVAGSPIIAFAQDFENLATRTLDVPEGYLALDAKAFSTVFQQLNHSFPPPQALLVPRQDLSTQYPGLLPAIEADQIRMHILWETKLLEMDQKVIRELTSAGIVPIANTKRITGEVPTLYTGRIGHLELYRAWRYWVVESQPGIPLEHALRIYDHPIGRNSVRTDGFAGNKKPEASVSVYHVDRLEGLRLLVQTALEIPGIECQRALDQNRSQLVRHNSSQRLP